MIALEPALSPTEALARFADLPSPVLLQSVATTHSLSRYSYLSADPVDLIVGSHAAWPTARDGVRNTLRETPARITHLPPFQGGWIGWLGYDLGEAFESIARPQTRDQPFHDIGLALHDWVIAWDHDEHRVWLISSGVNADGVRDDARAELRAAGVMQRWQASGTGSVPTGASAAPTANMDRAEYERVVARAVEYVLAGDIFQVNLAQRFAAPFTGDAVDLYRRVCQRAPAPMAAFVQRADATVISASPERFLAFDAPTRIVETRPIKGTRPRGVSPDADATLAHELQASEKDRAENVMIVDLLRNDLSRVCRAGSVRATALCALESHATVHHLVSTVIGQLREECDVLDLIAATFPGGSITGAPKRRAREIIAELEPVARGVYSGALGWIGLDGSMDTNIVIRSIAIAGGLATVHAGGGITARSVSSAEYEESLDKARALRAALEDPE